MDPSTGGSSAVDVQTGLLPYTGSNLGLWLTIGLALLVIGWAVFTYRRA